MNSRKAIIQAYKETILPAGVFQIRNLETGKVLILSSLNLPGAFNRHPFQLEMGGHQNRELQNDWKKSGPKNFVLEILETLPPHEDGSEFTPDELQDLEKAWLKKVQPYGDKGYNEKTGQKAVS